MRSIILFIITSLLLVTVKTLYSQSITGVDSYQEGQTIRIIYQLNSTVPVEVKVEYSKDGGKSFFTLKQVSGDVGKGINAGQKQIVWRVLEEVPELVGDGVVFRVSVISTEWRPGTILCDTPTEIVPVYSPKTGKTWMDRNLGASRVATSPTDEAAYGDLYQWGRFADGHQCRKSGTTATLSSTDRPGHEYFIKTDNDSFDWRSAQKDNLWQGVNGINNPCPIGYRVPTIAELEEERMSWTANNSKGAFASALKLPLGGYRYYANGSLGSMDSYGYYWSATVSGTNTRYLNFPSGNAYLTIGSRGYGLSVRCIQD
jgi:hypothetical protein